MIEAIDGKRLIEQVINKHNRFLDTFKSEFSEFDSRLNAVRQQSDMIKKEIETIDSRIAVLTEKYHLLFHQAKKQREELFTQVTGKMRADRVANTQSTMRLGSRIEEFEKKLQTSKNIDDEEKIIAELKKLFYELESAAGKAGVTITCRGIVDKLNEANSSHKELLSLQGKPKELAASAQEYNKQQSEIDGRYNWLKHRIESHTIALDYWERQKGGIKVD
jgi:chromosome segregation ATPase